MKERERKERKTEANKKEQRKKIRGKKTDRRRKKKTKSIKRKERNLFCRMEDNQRRSKGRVWLTKNSRHLKWAHLCVFILSESIEAHPCLHISSNCLHTLTLHVKTSLMKTVSAEFRSGRETRKSKCVNWESTAPVSQAPLWQSGSNRCSTIKLNWGLIQVP